ncbi:MAG: endolytic transglycosylase MltG [Anaerolineales bacterium]|nr:endolytic transglycosylase MltG [Anaerolineales bacterium]
MPRRTRQSSSFLGAFFLPLVALALMIIIILAAGIWSITTRAEVLFGHPQPGLHAEQRLVLSIMMVIQADSLTEAAYPGAPLQDFRINQGESIPSITGRLLDAELITNPAAFRSYLQYTGLDKSIQAGEYAISAGMTPIEIAQIFQQAPLGQAVLTVLPGWRAEEIAAALPLTGFSITAEEFLLATQIQPQGYSFSAEIPLANIEGFLFPATYEMARETSVQQLIPAMLSNFDALVSPEIRSGFSEQGLTLYQAVVLASIIEREAILDEEMPLIASVFHNRLVAGATLSSDPTIQYALGFNNAQNTWWTNPLSASDLQFDSPYNTYLYPGLPPTPICSPGLAALRAAAFPAQTPYYYFRAACDGSSRHLFAETYQEHLDNACP